MTDNRNLVTLFNAHSTQLGKLLKNDATRMSTILGRWASTIGLLEFLFNPTIGRLSDKIGRRPFMLCSPIACVVLKTWVFFSPSVVSLTFEKIICDGLRTLSGSTMCAAALSDLLSGEDLAVAFGELYAWAGVSIIAAPFLSGLMPSPRLSFAASAIVSVFQLVLEYKYLEETLPCSPTTSLKDSIEFVNPFQSVIRLFRTSPRLSLLSLITTMHYLVEPKNLSDVSALQQLSFMGWSDRKRANFVSVIGISFLVGGYISKRSVKRLGLLGHTKLCHVLSFVQFLLRAFCTEVSTWAASVIALYSETRNYGIKALGTRYASRMGIGKGEFAGLIASLRALMVFTSPILFGELFRRGIQIRPKARPGLPFVGAMFGVVIGEMALRKLESSSSSSSHHGRDDDDDDARCSS